MKKLLLGLAFALAVIMTGSPVMAADIDEPPPVNFDPVYDWTGAYLGIFGAAIAVDGHYDANPLCVPGPCAIVDPDMSGIGYGFGAVAGLDYQMDNFVFGVAGDWMFGGKIADNDDPVEATYLYMNDLATLRARAGFADGRTLIYLTGGVAAAEMEFGGLVGSIAEDVSDAEWTWGWTVGGGIEHAFTDSLSVSLEYLYISLDDTHHTLINSIGEGGAVDMQYNDMHVVRAGLNYRFNL